MCWSLKTAMISEREFVSRTDEAEVFSSDVAGTAALVAPERKDTVEAAEEMMPMMVMAVVVVRKIKDQSVSHTARVCTIRWMRLLLRGSVPA